WQIANVAVAPAYRGRGIGRALMEAALDHIRLRGGTWAVLQVRADNEIARRLYERLGFEAITGTSELQRPEPPSELLPLPASPPLKSLSAGAWREIYELATIALPPLAQWWQPVRPHRFCVSPDQRLGEWLNRLIGMERVWRLGVYQQERLVAAMIVRGSRWHPPHQLEIWVHPERRGKWEDALVARALNLLVGYPGWEIETRVNTEHPQLIEALQEAGFIVRRTLITMRRRVIPEEDA
ncbi:MAG TPA: GNAT family N-acetyltransferase, partial [Caldilineae bacterium]|nr:GNAT family N-acetyltransferase [Caldilineae bacterium]